MSHTHSCRPWCQEVCLAIPRTARLGISMLVSVCGCLVPSPCVYVCLCHTHTLSLFARLHQPLSLECAAFKDTEWGSPSKGGGHFTPVMSNPASLTPRHVSFRPLRLRRACSRWACAAARCSMPPASAWAPPRALFLKQVRDECRRRFCLVLAVSRCALVSRLLSAQASGCRGVQGVVHAQAVTLDEFSSSAHI